MNNDDEMEYLIGTSGFSYDDWRGHFYPKDMKKGEFLQFYSNHFKTTEVNSTYYRIPSPKVIEKMVQKVPPEFVFSVKANGVFTHSRDYTLFDVDRMKGVLRAFGEKLGVVLFQFPYSFHKSEDSKDYIKKIRDKFSDFTLAYEFRSREWFSPDVFSLLRDIDVGIVCVDEPNIRGLIPPIAVATNPHFAYIRFHGRNAQKWYEHERPEERYDYLYSEEELEPWAEKMRKLAVDKVFIYFNNHPRAQAVLNAKMMEKILNG